MVFYFISFQQSVNYLFSGMHSTVLRSFPVARVHLLNRLARSPQHISGTSSGSGSGHDSASTVFIPAEEDIPDMGSTISSLSRSSFRSVPMDSPYQSESFYSARRPRSIDDTSLPSHGKDFMSPSDAHITIPPSRTSSLLKSASMTDLDKYIIAASPRTETF